MIGHRWSKHPTIKVHRTYQCKRCGVILSGLTPRDLAVSEIDSIGKCEGKP